MRIEGGKKLVDKFDLIVIGSGSGLDVANAVAEMGFKVAIIEKGRMGGTCLNRGCIPSKLLIHSADVIDTIKSADKFGITVSGYNIDFKKIIDRVNKIVDSDADQIRQAFKGLDNPRLFPRLCKFVGNKTIEVEDIQGDDKTSTLITADKILIASGTRPTIPKIPGLEKGGYITSDEALRLTEQPKVLTIIGGGLIAAELGHFYGSLGTKINIIQRNHELLSYEDEEVSKKFTELFSQKYNVYLDSSVESVQIRKGEKSYTESEAKQKTTTTTTTFLTTIRNHSKESKDKDIQTEAKTTTTTATTITIESDQLLIAVGRTPNSDLLDLDKTGVKVNEKGFISVDEYLETSIRGIYALGDAIGRYQFKHSANHEAQYAFQNITHPENKIAVDYAAMPHAIFSSPQIAGVGYTEQQLKKAGIVYSKVVYYYKDTAMGQAIEDTDGFVKFLFEKENGKILGCHILGAEASILIHEVLIAMKSGSGTMRDIIRTIHIHPALSEVISRAAASAAFAESGHRHRH